MKKTPLSLTMLVVAVAGTTMAFSACTGGSTETPTEQTAPAEQAAFPFPKPDDAMNIKEMQPGQHSYETMTDLQGVLDFYKMKMVAEGLTEREITTVMSDTTLNLVFDGSENGQALVIQAVDLGDKNMVTIRYEEI